MTFKIDVIDEVVIAWRNYGDEQLPEVDPDYTPTFYIGPGIQSGRRGVKERTLQLEEYLDDHPEVVSYGEVDRRPFFGKEPISVHAVSTVSLPAVRSVAQSVEHMERPGSYPCYEVDLQPGFRYCLDTNITPLPRNTLSTTRLEIPRHKTSVETLDALTIDNEQAGETPIEAAEVLADHLRSVDPDVLIVSTAELIPIIAEAAFLYDVNIPLSRVTGLSDHPDIPSNSTWYQQLAGSSTYTSYGNTEHSPARYNVLGRVVVDESNTHLFTKTGLQGCLDLVKRTQKPLQEIAWESVGSILTAMEIREARSRDVLVPHDPVNYEQFKPAQTLHDADRGGHIFSPKVGVHYDVHELDFASLYPNIICTRNISPETILCDCHHSRTDIPELGYNVCDREGYLPTILWPIIEDRAQLKREAETATSEEYKDTCEAKIEALKWILVSSFGYQGFSNAKFGRIECHEAINACARDILLQSKSYIESNGWDVLHGIVDSLWITKQADSMPLHIEELCEEVTDETGIQLEYEHSYDWVAFPERKSMPGGSLNRYFGKIADCDEYVIKGIEYRQESTPTYIKDAQCSLIETLDKTESPEAICDVAFSHINALKSGDVDPSHLFITETPTKTHEDYKRDTPISAAVARAHSLDRPTNPGQPLSYIVVDTDDQLKHRVRLESEPISDYDPDYYCELMKQATESVIAPFGWTRKDINQFSTTFEEPSLYYY